MIDYEINVSPWAMFAHRVHIAASLSRLFVVAAVGVGVVGAGAGVVFVRVNNCCKVSPPRVSRVMGTFIAAFINLHITITTAGRPMCHVISAEKGEIIGLPEKQGC